MAVLFEMFLAFFGAGGLAPIKAKKAEIAGRARRQAIWVRLSSAYAEYISNFAAKLTFITN